MNPATRTKIGSMFVVAMFLTTAWVGCIPSFDMGLSFSFGSDAEATSYSVTYHLESEDEGYTDAEVSTPYTIKSLSDTGLYDGPDKIYGWATTSGGSKEYNEGQEISSITGNIVLYPVWQAGNITYKTTDGTHQVDQARGTSESLVVKTFTAVYDEEPSFAPEDGYQFFCWSISKTGEGTTYSPGNIYSAKADLVLYPIYIPDTDAASYCGPNMKFRIADGVLTLIGSGQINDYGQGHFPWDDVDKYDKSTITTITLPYGISEIPDFAFNGFTNEQFQQIYLPDNLNSIGVGVFIDCDNLSEINVGAGNQTYSAKDGVLFYIYGFDEESGCDKTELVCFPPANEGINGDDVYIVPYWCTKIQDYAFYGNAKLTDVYLSEKVCEIGDYAFYDCTSITTVSTPDGLTSIGDSAFQGCSGIVAVQFGIGLSHLGVNSFKTGGTIYAIMMDYKRTVDLNIEGAFTKENGDDLTWYHYFNGNYLNAQGQPVSRTSAEKLSTSTCSNGHIYLSENVEPTDPSKDHFVRIFYLGNYQVESDNWSKVILHTALINGSEYSSNITNWQSSPYGRMTTSLLLQGGISTIGRLQITGNIYDPCVYVPMSTQYLTNAFEACKVQYIYLHEGVVAWDSEWDSQLHAPILSNISLKGIVCSPGNSGLSVDGDALVQIIEGKYTTRGYANYGDKVRFFSDKLDTLGASSIRTSKINGTEEGIPAFILPDSLTTIKHANFGGYNYLACIAFPHNTNCDASSSWVFRYWDNCVSIIFGPSMTYINSTSSMDVENFKVLVVSSETGCDNVQRPSSGKWYDYTGTEVKYTTRGHVDKGIYVSDPAYTFKDIVDASGNKTGLVWTIVEENICRYAGSEDPEKASYKGNVLTIAYTGEGSGMMPDYDSTFLPPWADTHIDFVNISEGIVHFGANAFKNQSSLRSCNIPYGTQSIGEYCFYGTSIEGVYIPCTVRTIGDVKGIGDHAFDNCEDMEMFYVSDSVAWTDGGIGRNGNKEYTSYDGVLMNKDLMTVIKCPEGKTGSFTPPYQTVLIKDFAFLNSKLSSVAFYQTVGSTEYGITTIQNNAFESSNIQMADLKKVSSLGASAFANCSNLTTLIAGSSLSTFPTKAFEGCEYLYNMSFEASSLTFNAYSMPYKMKYTEAMGEDESISIEEGTGYLKDDIGYYALYTINGDTSNRVKIRSHDWNLSAGIQYSSIPVSSMDQCGQHLFYAYIETPKLLLITGTGDMYDYQDSDGKRAPWYSMRASIQKISLPTGMTNIGDYAFIGTKITSVSLPSTIKTIGSHSFYETDLSTLVLPSSVTGIGTYAFASTNLSSLEVNIRIPDYAFYNCESLKSVVVGTGVQEIGVSSFGDCSILATVIFQGATNLDTSSFPAYPGYWFENGIGSAVGTIPDIAEACYYTKEYQGSSAINCGTYNESTGEYSNNLKYNISNSILIITGSGDMADLSSDSTELWRDSSFSSVVFPIGLTHVGTYTFKGSHITSANLSACSSLETIGEGSFCGASALTSVSIPEGVSIGASAFINCAELSDLDVGDSASFGNDAFKGCTSITSVSLKDVRSMGSSVFEGCTGLKTATLTGIYDSNQNGGYTTEIGDYNFKDCTSLQTASVNKVKTVGASTFSGCKSLMLGDLVEVKDMGSSQFTGCTKLTNLKLTSMPVTSTSMSGISGPITLTISGAEIGSNSFQSHTTIVAIQTGASGNTSTIGSYAFQNCTSLTTVSLTDVVSIGDGAFQNCTSLESFVVTPTKLTSMGEGVFTDSKQGMTVNGSELDNLSYTPATSSTVMKYAIDNHADPKIELIINLEYNTPVSTLSATNTGKTLTIDLSGYSLTVPNDGWTLDHGIVLTTEDSSPLDTGRFSTSSDTAGVPYYDWIHINTPDRVKYMIGENVYWRALHDGELLLSYDSFKVNDSKLFIKWNNGTTGTMCDQCLLDLHDEGTYYTQNGNSLFGTADGFIVKAVSNDVSYRSTYTA